MVMEISNCGRICAIFNSFFVVRHYKMKFDLDPDSIFRLLLQFHLIRCSKCKKTSLTSLYGT